VVHVSALALLEADVDALGEGLECALTEVAPGAGGASAR